MQAYRNIQELGICAIAMTNRGVKAGWKSKHKHMAMFGLLNARSVVNKSEGICDHVIDYNLDIIGITETWLTQHSDVELKAICPPGYSISHAPRCGRRGGGVAIMHRDSIHLTVQPPYKTKSFESLEAMLTISSTSVRLVILYRPPPSKVNKTTKVQFTEDFSTYLETLSCSSGKLIIAGDFNFPMDNQSHPDTKSMNDLFESSGLVQHVNDSTHMSGHMLDLVLSKPHDQLITSTKVSTLISDHHAIHVSLNLNRPPLPKKLSLCRNFKKLDLDAFKEDLSKLKVVSDPPDDLDTLTSSYNSDIASLLDKHVPAKTKIVTVHPYVPWYCTEISSTKKLCRKAEAKWRQTHLTVHRDIYCTFRNKKNKLIRDAKVLHYNKAIDECDSDQKALFRIVKTLLGQNTKLKLPSYDTVDDVLENFSHFFTSKIQNIRQKLEHEVSTESVCQSSLPTVDNYAAAPLTSFHTMSVEDVSKLIKKSPTKSSSLDPLPTWLLKECIEVLAPVITHVINTSLLTNTFPSEMKNALITPLLKKPSLDPESYKNYRPVSNLSFLSKLNEKAVAQQLSNHMVQNNLHAPVQSAYRPHHSTETALLKVMNDLLISVDKGHGVILVMLDLSAAFDTVDHDILIDRLCKHIGITGKASDWLRSYLTERFQSIHLNGHSSQRMLLLFGVPQGSVLGPILFSVYQIPLFNIAEQHGVKSHFYADDTQIYYSFDLNSSDDYDSAVSRLNACLRDIRIWMSHSKLKLNDDKTELLVISSSRKHPNLTENSIKIGDCSILPSKTAKTLGVVLDDSLKLDSHISSVAKNCHFHLRNIGKIRKYLSPDSTSKVVHALISSRLDYNNALFFGLPDFQIQKLQRIQNTAARIVTRTSKFDHITPHLQKLHWLPVEYRIKFKILMLTYRCLHNLGPDYLKNLLHPYQPVRTLRSSADDLLTIPRTNLSTYGDRAFSKAAPVLWNSLPSHLRSQDTLESFKSSLKSFFFTEAFAAEL
jgi:hypothetical protein